MVVERKRNDGTHYTEFRMAYYVEVLEGEDWIKRRRYACSSISAEDATKKASEASDINRLEVEAYWRAQHGIVGQAASVLLAPPLLSPTLKEAAAEWMLNSRRWRDNRQVSLSPSYIRRVDNYVRKLETDGLADRKLREMRAVELQAWFNAQCEIYAGRTAKNFRGWLIGLGEFAVINDYWNRNLFKLLKRVELDTTRKMRVLSLDEIDCLWDAARTPQERACLVLLRLGLRQGEVLGLTADDFVDESTIMINHTLSERPNAAYKAERGNSKMEPYLGFTKTVRSRSAIHVPSGWMEILQESLALAKPCPVADNMCEPGHFRYRRFVISNRFGHLWSEWCASRAMRRLIARAGVLMNADDPTWHCWRHSYASDLVALSIDDIALGRLMRHADPAITRGTYSHARDAYRDRYRPYSDGIANLNDYNEALCRFDTERRALKASGNW